MFLSQREGEDLEPKNLKNVWCLVFWLPLSQVRLVPWSCWYSLRLLFYLSPIHWIIITHDLDNHSGINSKSVVGQQPAMFYCMSMVQSRVESQWNSICRGPDCIICHGKLKLMRVIPEARVDSHHNQLLEALHDGRCKCYWTVVIEAGHHALHRHRYNKCSFEADGYLRPQKRRVEDVHEYSSQLVHTGLQNSGRFIIWARCPMWIHLLEVCSGVNTRYWDYRVIWNVAPRVGGSLLLLSKRKSCAHPETA